MVEAEPAAWVGAADLAMLVCVGVAVAACGLRAYRVKILPGVYIGCVGFVALIATVLPDPQAWQRAILVLVGTIFLVAEVAVLYRDRALFEMEARNDRAHRDEAFTSTMVSFATLQQIVNASHEAHRRILQVADEIRASVGPLADRDRREFIRRAWTMVSVLNDLVEGYFYQTMMLEAARRSTPDAESGDTKLLEDLKETLRERHQTITRTFTNVHFAETREFLNELRDVYHLENYTSAYCVRGAGPGHVLNIARGIQEMIGSLERT